MNAQDEIDPTGNELLFGRYRVIRELGRGGMGVVLLARDGELNIDTAIKVIPDLLLQDREGLDELKREVLRGMALTHPGIVRTHGFVRDATMAAIAMEYVDGGNFTALKLSHPGGCFDTESLLPWLEQLGPVLDYAHFEIKIAHRDLKPSNLMLTKAGRIKVADFGISSTINDTVTRVSMRHSSSGTPAYMSPQQVMGERASHLDDIYALGATIYELLTGKPPFYQGQVLAQVLDTVPATMTKRRKELGLTGKGVIPPAWEETVAACLAKDPGKRPQSAGEVVARLKGAKTGHLPSVRPSKRLTATRSSGPSRSGRRWVAVALTAVMLAAGYFLIGNTQAVKQRPASGGEAALKPAEPPAPVPEAPRITSPDELPSGRVGDPYSYEMTATGGVLPYQWSLDGGQQLPEGLSINSAGIIGGTPAIAGETTFVVKVAGHDGLESRKPTRLAILAQPPPPPPVPVPEPVAKTTVPAESAAPMIAADQEHPYENSLGMRFVPAGTPEVLVSIWLTRVVDFRAFATDAKYDATANVHSVEIGGRYGFIYQADQENSWEKPGFAQTDNLPVCGVSWDDATAFCKWLTDGELRKGKLPAGFKYRLPTDAEWKNALSLPLVNPGTAIRYPWGNYWPPPDAGNFAGLEMRDGGVTPRDWPVIAGFRDDFIRTSPVDRPTLNKYGIRDPYGNLWQFCEDPAGEGVKSYLMRGGSWATSSKDELAIDKPSKKRRGDARVVDAGFRCVIARSK